MSKAISWTPCRSFTQIGGVKTTVGIKNMVVLKAGSRTHPFHSKVVLMNGSGCVIIFLKIRTGRQVLSILVLQLITYCLCLVPYK